MLEVSLTGNNHRRVAGIDQIDGLPVLHRPAGVDNRRHASVQKQLRTVGKREKGVAGGDGMGGTIARLGDRQPGGGRPIHLPGAGAQ